MFECGYTRLPIGCVTVDKGDMTPLGIEISCRLVPGSILNVCDSDVRSPLCEACDGGKPYA